jgi:hypothetical protein
MAGFEVQLCDTAGPEYRYVSWVKFRLPHGRWSVQKMIPPPLFHFLRKVSITKRLRVQEREHAFYKYGGFRIWVRSVSRKPLAQTTVKSDGQDVGKLEANAS